jgi:hypothetical protein
MRENRNLTQASNRSPLVKLLIQHHQLINIKHTAVEYTFNMEYRKGGQA